MSSLPMKADNIPKSLYMYKLRNSVHVAPVVFSFLLLEVFFVLWWKKGGKIWEQESELIDVKLVNTCEIGKDWFFPQLNFVNVNEGDIKYRYSLWCCEGYPLKVLVWNMLVIVIKAVELFLCHTGGIFCQIYFSCFFSSSFFLSNIRTIFVIKMKMLPDLAFVSLALCIFFLLWKWYLWVKSL